MGEPAVRAGLGGGGPLGWRQHEQRRDKASGLGGAKVCEGKGGVVRVSRSEDVRGWAFMRRLG